jgi:hypothetical protein
VSGPPIRADVEAQLLVRRSSRAAIPRCRARWAGGSVGSPRRPGRSAWAGSGRPPGRTCRSAGWWRGGWPG